jgi:hypothetical protein
MSISSKFAVAVAQIVLHNGQTVQTTICRWPFLGHPLSISKVIYERLPWVRACGAVPHDQEPIELHGWAVA